MSFNHLVIMSVSQARKPQVRRTDLPTSCSYSKEDTQMANRSMRRCSVSLSTRERQIKATVRGLFTPTRMVVIKKRKNRWTNPVLGRL